MNRGDVFAKIETSQKGNLVFDKKGLCYTTQFAKQNNSGHARGRSAHLTIDGKKSICNQKVDLYFNDIVVLAGRKFCKICFKNIIDANI